MGQEAVEKSLLKIGGWLHASMHQPTWHTSAAAAALSHTQ